MVKYQVVAAAVLAACFGMSAAPASADWRAELGTYNIGLLSGENEADRLRRYECLQTLLAEELAVPVELYPAADYAGVMQGLLAGQLHQAGLGASSFAGLYMQDPEAVEPIFTVSQVDGSVGYYSIIYVRADSDIQSLEDLEGRSLAFADPNSTSGYLVPRAELRALGIDEDSYFSETGFSGGHEQGVVSVLNGQYDAGVTWFSGIGEKSEGFSRSSLRKMVENGLLDMDDVRIVWQSSLIPDGPIVLRKDLPPEARAIVTEFFRTIHVEHPECHATMEGGDVGPMYPVDVDFYASTIEMRRREIAESR